MNLAGSVEVTMDSATFAMNPETISGRQGDMGMCGAVGTAAGT